MRRANWYLVFDVLGKGKGKVPLQAWSGPEGSRKLRFPDFVTTAQDGGKVVSLTRRPTFWDNLSIAGYAVTQLVEALSYKPEVHGFESRWCHLNFSLT